MVLGIAKQLLITINQGTMDDFTKKIFKRQRNRKPVIKAVESGELGSTVVPAGR